MRVHQAGFLTLCCSRKLCTLRIFQYALTAHLKACSIFRFILWKHHFDGLQHSSHSNSSILNWKSSQKTNKFVLRVTHTTENPAVLRECSQPVSFVIWTSKLPMICLARKNRPQIQELTLIQAVSWIYGLVAQQGFEDPKSTGKILSTCPALVPQSHDAS